MGPPGDWLPEPTGWGCHDGHLCPRQGPGDPPMPLGAGHFRCGQARPGAWSKRQPDSKRPLIDIHSTPIFYYMSIEAFPHWKLRVAMMPTLSSPVAPKVVVMTTYGATIDKVDVMATLGKILRCQVPSVTTTLASWWRHQMETFSA